MFETRTVLSSHFGVRHGVAGCNIHLPPTQKQKNKWFVYLEECIHPEGIYQYIGSTDSMTHRWANTKSKIISLAGNPALKASTGLENHYKSGCSQFSGSDLSQIRVTLLEHMNVKEEDLQAASHLAGPGCRCNQCQKLKDIEDKWICRMGTFHGVYGLNERDEVRRRARGSY